MIGEQIDKKNDQWYLAKIPKVAHFYWGANILPFIRYASILSFAKKNPDWDLKVYIPTMVSDSQTWITGEQGGTNYNGKDYLDNLSSIARVFKVDPNKFEIANGLPEVYKSDILRMEILHKFGGLWCDTDILFFKPISEMTLNKVENSGVDLGLCIHHEGHHYIGFFFSCIKNGFIEYIKTNVRKNYNPNLYQTFGSTFLSQQFPTMDKVREHFISQKIVNIPFLTVYPYNWQTIHEAYKKNDLRPILEEPSCIGLHWFGGDKRSVEFSNIVSEENIDSFNHILGQLIKKVIKE